MLDCARAAATDALLDQRLFMVDKKQFRTVERAIAKAPKAETLVKALQKRPSPWKT